VGSEKKDGRVARAGFPEQAAFGACGPALMRDLILVILLTTFFAAAVTTHVAILAGLVRRRPRWRAAVALAFPPLAPVWAYTERMRIRAVLWGVTLGAYLVTLMVAR